MIRPTFDHRSISVRAAARRRPLNARLSAFACALAGLGALAAAATGCESTPVCGAGGAGGGAGGGGGAAAVVVPAIGCADPDPGLVDYIDDMEDGTPTILGRDGRRGTWYTFHDMTAGTLNPDQGVQPMMEPIVGGRCGATTSTRAMRVTGSGFTDWGAGFGFGLNYMSKELFYDATRFRGITFWARVGETSVSSLQLGVGDQWSRPDGGNCDITVTSGPLACYDTFGSLMTFTTSWKRYTMLFGQMQQRSFGLPRPALEQTSLMSIEFGIPPGAPVFDFWIDDIAFFE